MGVKVELVVNVESKVFCRFYFFQGLSMDGVGGSNRFPFVGDTDDLTLRGMELH